MAAESGFAFRDPGPLIDDDVELILVEQYPGDPSRNYVPAYQFEMHRTGTTTTMGRIELRVGNPAHLVKYGGHIGYEVVPEYRGHRYAARSCRLLLGLACAHGLNPLWSPCTPDNGASRRTCELIGGALVEIIALLPESDLYQQGERWKCRSRIPVGAQPET